MSGAGPRPAAPRALTCPNCGAPVRLRASGSTVSAVCPNCTAVLDVNEDASLRLVAAAQARTVQPAIPIGSRGVLGGPGGGTEWEAVGYQARSLGSGWEWEEYLLFNPYQGFRFLLQDHGAWSLYRLLRRDFADGVPGTYTAGETSTARTDYVLGEFYWRVRVGDAVQVREYVDTYSTLSEEWTDTERTWSEGRALDVAAVRGAFGLAGLPGRELPAGMGRLWMVAGVACGLLLLLSAVPFGQYRNQVVLRTGFEARDAGEQVVTEFELPGRGGSLVVEASSPFTDDAATAQLKLLPAAGAGRAGFTATVELGGAFGGTAAPRRVTFADVPGGRYRLAAAVDTPGFHAAAPGSGVPDAVSPYIQQFLGTAQPPGAATPAVVPVRVTLRRHPASSGAVVVTLAALLLWPAVVGVQRLARAQAGG